MKSNSGKNPPISQATLFAQADGYIDPQTGGIVPPIQPSSTFTRDRDYQLISGAHNYGRDDNDLLRLGEEILTKAEKGEDGLLFPSGMAATAAVMRTVGNGGKILLQSGIYWGTTKWAREFCARRNIELLEMDSSDTGMHCDAIETFAPDLVFAEIPSNPWLKLVDISAASKACISCGATLIVDSTAATPVLSNPLGFGADIVMHSATKAINGHSDVLAGFLAVKDANLPIWEAIKTDRHDAGALLGSFEAWLLIRGMRTLPLRVERMSKSSLKIARFLAQHDQVVDVLYPGLSDHPQHELAKRQMRGGFGSLMSILVKGNSSTSLEVCGNLNIFKRATSLGGVESLVERRHSIEEAIDPNLIRISVGIECADELIDDLDQALII
jgi:cystathionine gamma-synthase